MNNYSTAQDYAKAATESSGTALEKFQAYEESVEAKTEALTAAVEGLVNNFASSDFMKVLLDVGKGLVNAADSAHLLQIALGALGVKATLTGFSKLGKTINTLKTQYTTLYTAFNILDGSTGKTIERITDLEDILNQQGLTIANLNKTELTELLTINAKQLKLDELTKEELAELLIKKNVNKQTAESIAAELAETGAIQAESVSLKELIALKAKEFGMRAAKLLTNPYVMAGIAITAIIGGLVAWKKHQEKIIAQAHEIKETYQNSQNELKQQAKSAESTATELANLSKGVKVGLKGTTNISLTNEEYQRFLELSNDLAEEFPELVRGWDEQGNAILNYNNLLQQTIDLQEKKIQKDREDFINSRNAYKDKGYKEYLKGYQADLKQYATVGFHGTDVATALQESGVEFTRGFKTLLETAVTEGTQALAAQASGGYHPLDAIITDVNSSFYKELLTNRNQILASIKDETVKVKVEAFLDNIQTNQDAITNLSRDIADGLIENLQVNVATRDKYKQIAGGFLDDFQAGLNDLSSDPTKSIAELETESASLLKSFLAIQDSIPTSEVESLSQSLVDGKISQEEYNAEMQKIIASVLALANGDQNLLAILTNITNGWWNYTNELTGANEATEAQYGAVADLTDSLKEAAQAIDTVKSAQEEYNETGYLSINTLEDLLKLDDEHLATLIDENGQLALNTAGSYALLEAKLGLAEATAQNALTEAMAIDTAAKTSQAYSILSDNALDAAQKVSALNAALAGGQIDTSGWETGTKAALASYQLVEDTITKLRSGTYKGGYKAPKSSSSKSSGSQKDAWLEAYKEELAELDHLKKMDKISTKEYYNELDRLTKKYFSGRNKYHKEERENLEKLWDLYKQILDEEKERYETALKYVDNVIDKRIEELEKEKKALEDKNKAKEDELKLEQLEDNLRKAKQRTMRVFYSDVGWVNLQAQYKGNYIG